MTHLTESTLEETALEWLGCQRIACGKTDERMLASLRGGLSQLVGEVRISSFHCEWRQLCNNH